MSFFNFTTAEIVEMLVALVVLVGFSIWAQHFRKRQYDFIGHRNIFFIVSGVLLLVSIGSITLRGLNYGLDFTGGTILELNFTQAPSGEVIREILVGVDPELGDATIQIAQLNAQGVTPVLIRTRELQAEQVNLISEKLAAKFGQVDLLKQESIGPIIGAELRNKALLAILISLGIQLIYISFRFGSQTRYGLAADLGMAHDVVIMVGIYSLVGRQVDSPFVAALLTVIGYSVMDSIVIFDRIRENLKLTERGTFSEVVNLSVNQTMTRSINTLLTVLVTLFALYYFGGATLRNFAFALLVGVTCGAYSSIFVASPLLVMIDDWVKKREKVRVEARRANLAQRAQQREQEISERRRRKPVVAQTADTAQADYPNLEETGELAASVAERKSSGRRSRPGGRRRRR